MSIIGNINGWPLVAMPSTPGPRQVEWNATDVVAAVTNPFTGKQQTQNWQAGWLEATVTLPPMKRVLAAAWIAFLLQAQGQNAVFYFAGDSLNNAPQGTAEGDGQINGIFQQPYLLTTNNWTPSQSGLLLPGDWLQVNWRMYMNLNLAASDGAGNASLAIWPQMREQPASGTGIVTTNAQGLFRLASNQRKWSESYLTTFGISFGIREAI
jgi:hypothetical protein